MRFGWDSDLWFINIAGLIVGVAWFGWWFLVPAFLLSFKVKF